MDTRGLVKTKRKFKSTQLFVVAGTILVSLLISLLCVGLTVRYEVDTETADIKSIEYWKLDLPPQQDQWFVNGIDELRSVIVKKEQVAEVENVVIFIVDGVSNEMLSRARFRQKDNNEEAQAFIWDTFRHLGILKSTCSYQQECDAFTLGTALFGGVRTSKGLGGLDGRVESGNCNQALNTSYHVNSIFEEAKVLNKRCGFVTTERVTSPLLAALYAHSSETRWECDGYMPPNSLKSNCQDVASQLLKTKEGTNIHVIMGGGRQTLISMDALTNRSTLDPTACISMDKRDLLQDWQSSKMRENVTYTVIQSSKSLESLNGSSMDYVLGIFANGDLTDKDPQLKDMVKKSLDVLKRSNNGYILVVETAVKTKRIESLQQKLWELDETIRETIEHPNFTTNNTVLLTIFLDINRNSGVHNDILLYASGPQSHLFHGVHDDTYMAHVILYNLKMGIFRPSKILKKKK